MHSKQFTHKLAILSFVLLSTFCFSNANASPSSPKPHCQWEDPQLAIGKKGNFKGWKTYQPALECTSKQLTKDTANTKTLEGTLIKFFGALMHRRKSFMTLLSPSTHPVYRKLIEKNLLHVIHKPAFHRFIVHARLSSKTNPQQIGRSGRRFLTTGKLLFGSFDYLVFMEGNTNKDDLFVYLEKKKKRWYIKGFLANSLEPIFRKVKPWWSSKKTKKPTSKKAQR